VCASQLQQKQQRQQHVHASAASPRTRKSPDRAAAAETSVSPGIVFRVSTASIVHRFGLVVSCGQRAGLCSLDRLLCRVHAFKSVFVSHRTFFSGIAVQNMNIQLPPRSRFHFAAPPTTDKSQRTTRSFKNGITTPLPSDQTTPRSPTHQIAFAANTAPTRISSAGAHITRSSSNGRCAAANRARGGGLSRDPAR